MADAVHAQVVMSGHLHSSCGLGVPNCRTLSLLLPLAACLQDAIRDNPGFIYLEAATDPQQFSELLAQTAAAAAVASKAAAAAAAAAAEGEEVAGTWEPPPADVHPETEEDYA